MPPEQDEIAAAEPTSLRASLEAGFAAAEAPAAEVKPVASIPDAKAETPPETQAAAPAPAGDVPRDEAGRFAPKTGEAPAAPAEAKPAPTAETKTTDQPAAAGQEAPQGEPIQPPAAWTAASKAKWAALDPSVQAEIAKRETDMVSGMQKQAQAIKRFERMDEAIAPHRNRLAMEGTDEVTYVRSLVAADEQLRGPNPLGALAQIASIYNIDLRQIGQPGQQPQAGQQPQPAQPDPARQALETKVAGLEQRLAQYEGAAQTTAQTQIQAQIDAFSKGHLYYENVRPAMAAFLRTPDLAELAETNAAAAMEAAYDRACWADPAIRPLLLKEQTDKQQADARAEAAKRADEARQASGSVSGSPAPGATPAPGPAPSLRESLERGFNAYA